MRIGKVVKLDALQRLINLLRKEGKEIELVDYDFGDDNEAIVFYRRVKKPNRSGATRGRLSKVDMGFWWD